MFIFLKKPDINVWLWQKIKIKLLIDLSRHKPLSCREIMFGHVRRRRMSKTGTRGNAAVTVRNKYVSCSDERV